jgi:hypothetical protein
VYADENWHGDWCTPAGSKTFATKRMGRTR